MATSTIVRLMGRCSKTLRSNVLSFISLIIDGTGIFLLIEEVFNYSAQLNKYANSSANLSEFLFIFLLPVSGHNPPLCDS